MFHLLESGMSTSIILKVLEGFSLLPHLLIHLFNYFYQYEHMDIYFKRWVISQNYFVAQSISALAVGSTFRWLVCPFDTSLLLWVVFSFVFEHFITFWHHATGSFYIFPAPIPASASFSKEPRFLLLENGIRNQDLGPWCACCFRTSRIRKYMC